MSLDKAYDPSKYEPGIYKRWEESGAFKPAGDPKKSPFSLVLPPPNANGHIHVGTAMYVIEDIMIRYRRMQGHPTLWLPGTDHAGIETQVVFERLLAADGKSRFDLGREEFNKQVTEFTKSNQSIMIGELKSMGFSLDWSRLQFTLDEGIVATVYDTFKKMHDAGYIYRANRLVNWCPHCRSAFSDLEVKYREQIDPLYYIKYGPFVVATVRPEPMFADTAIAVHPKDERYLDYIGKTVDVELLWGKRSLKVYGDNFVDPNFGTGVIKLTPAHDPNDWEMAQRYNLDVIQGIGTDGLITEAGGRYAGMTVQDARQAVVHDLDERGLMDHIDMNYTHSVGYHDRCGTLIEPLTTEQWWLKLDELKKPVIKAVEDGDVTFVPSRFKKVELDWMHNLRDWNIGRQNWYGIRVPVFYNATGDTSLPEYIVASDEAEAIEIYGEGGYEAETDIFDTWFSSGQWPYATLKESAPGDFEKFYPTSVLETGRDILFPWVSRMLMFGLFATGQVPFKTVYLHGLVTDGTGKKMSKSKGNVINPLDMTSKYGTDALRLALTIGVTPGNDGAISTEKIEGYRNFCNKLWNVARFILEKSESRSMNHESRQNEARSEDVILGLDPGIKPSDPRSGAAPKAGLPIEDDGLSLADKWILTKLSDTTKQVTKDIEAYRFSEAGQAVYSLLWNDFADWYIEASKAETNLHVLLHCLETILKLAHPFAPFVTEAIWQEMPGHTADLITSSWPEASTRYPLELEQFEQIIKIVSGIREIIRDMHLKHPRILFSPNTDYAKEIEPFEKIIQGLALTGQFQQLSGFPMNFGLMIPNTFIELWVELDEDAQSNQVSRLKSEHAEKTAYIEKLDKQLANDRLPQPIRDQIQSRKVEAEHIRSKLQDQIATLE